ncbi:K1324 protein, partial [Piprites chloris]|nr:K1324 protein [Piprites chloris]
QSEYHYEYTACDSSGSRWRVAVPHSPGLCTGLPDPVRGTECSFSCKAGEFLEMQAQTCRPCAAGTYSLGTGVRFDEWDEVPRGFANVATNLELQEGPGDAAGNCSGMGNWDGENRVRHWDGKPRYGMWHQKGQRDGKPGWETRKGLWCGKPGTGMGTRMWHRGGTLGWETRVELSRGNNVLYWRTTAFSVWAKVPKPVLVRNIGITGVAFTSECFPCKPGTFAAAPGSASCQPCPADTFSGKGATACQPCEPGTYAEPGSGSCKPRPPCTDKDFFYTHTACDAAGETQLMYKWAEPKICSEELPEAARLPPSGVRSRCPPCNPGFAKGSGGSCQPCPRGSYSNGSACLSCPPGTEPALGLEYKWWNVLPPNMETTVLSGISFEYKGIAGWEVAGDFIYTAAAASDSDFMILTLVVPGFSPPSPLLEDTESREVGRITFVFETVCSVGCELYFMVGVNSRATSPVETWRGSTGRRSYTYVVQHNGTLSFTWAFQRTPYHQPGRRYTGDVAKLYSVNVTNVLGGVASFCRRCAPQPEGPCAPCPPGSALDPPSGSCRPCPPGTVLRGPPSGGTPSCHPCGPGTRSNQLRSLCYNNCSLALSLPGRTLLYEFPALGAGLALGTGPSFTPKGLRYSHRFQLSPCGHQGRKKASCADSVPQGRGGAPARRVTSLVCQAIVVPPEGTRGAVSSQPVSLGDTLLGVTTSAVLDGVVSPPELFPGSHPDLPDVIFFFRSNDVTQPCTGGRATTLRLRCDPLSPGSGTLAVPRVTPVSPAGVADPRGASLWGHGCHDVPNLGVPPCLSPEPPLNLLLPPPQKTTYVWREPRLCHGGVSLPPQESRPCRSVDFWLKVGISTGTCLAVLLAALAAYFWKKTQKLEYKYSKLVMDAAAREGEAASPDSCAIMEGEDAEDELLFATEMSLFGKLRALKAKRRPDGFDSVPLKSSSSSTDREL